MAVMTPSSMKNRNLVMLMAGVVVGCVISDRVGTVTANTSILETSGCKIQRQTVRVNVRYSGAGREHISRFWTNSYWAMGVMS